MRSNNGSLLLIGALSTAPSFGDEGMWTFHDFPRALVKQKYGVDVDQAWLDKVRAATIRLSNCTASFVSPAGLMLTNHHCAAACLDQHSTASSNLLQNGFLARRREEELRCGAQVADVLIAMENVTERVNAAVRGLDDQSRERGAQEDTDGARAGVRAGQRARQVRPAQVRSGDAL